MNTLLKLTLAGLLALTAAGCKYLDGNDSTDGQLLETKDQDQTASTFGSAPEKIWLERAKDNFRRGEYGLAERYYRQAIEERHNNVEAWLGLAASYDRLKRFDEADRAYKVVMAMAGSTPTILNNLGYHYMLKGDFAAAEQTFRSALAKDPTNQYIKNNLAQLAAWKAKAGAAG
jgi:Flp pilus assembly protein TadD